LHSANVGDRLNSFDEEYYSVDQRRRSESAGRFSCDTLLEWDFEDALVAGIAGATGSDYVVTRNDPDFAGSPVPAITPMEFLEAIAGIRTS
jgi:hypothetical protein